MLEVKDLYRRYTPKKGQPVVALDKVSIKFPDTGLIFVLGKSGSGKSTLLNVMGGLDKTDSGEIIIKGKSSKDFKQSDFDSYRNTYLGFIFQEYNILDEFNVGQNIALALELQGKKATTQAINEILEEVDLAGYGNRKTNELSGGQKQRVAIARALVKSPEIIFADEPTGALDSKTGIAVFDTLKKLSKEKLVVVVSHDREFAELYGDRVIELADGVVISDIEKTTISGEVKSKGVTLVDEKVIKINKGYVLTSSDMEIIREYLNKYTGERLISLDDKVNENVRHIARIDILGNKESFAATDESKIINKQGEFHSIRSKLSLKHCFRIGASSLKVKPIRLLITIILSIVAFGMFGLADTMGSYNKYTATLSSIKNESVSVLALEKNAIIRGKDYEYTAAAFTDIEDIEYINKKYNINVKGVYDIQNYNNTTSAQLKNFLDYDSSSANYFSTNVSGLYSSSEEELATLGFELIAGTYPTGKNEVAITKHIYDSFKRFGYKRNSPTDQLEPSAVTPENMIAKTISFSTNSGDVVYKITGIIDTKFDATKYDDLYRVSTQTGAISDFDIGMYMLSRQYKADCQYSYTDLLFTNDATIDERINNPIVGYNGSGSYTIGEFSSTFTYLSSFKDSGFLITKNNVKELASQETIINYENMMQYVYHNSANFSSKQITPINLEGLYEPVVINNLYSLLYYLNPETMVYYYAVENIKSAEENGIDFSEIYRFLFDTEISGDPLQDIDKVRYYEAYVKKILQENLDLPYYADTTYEEYYKRTVKSFIEPNLDDILNILPKFMLNLSIIDKTSNNHVDLYRNSEFNIIGIDFEYNFSPINEFFYIDEETIKNFTDDKGEIAFLLCPMIENQNILRQIISDNYEVSGDSDFLFKLQNSVMPSFQDINSTIESMAEVFLYIGIGFAVFASLMLFNFISISISYKKREIGILRAVGARSKDVFNIFFAESFIISMISYAFATIITFVVSVIINTSMKNEFSLAITFLTPSTRQVLLILAVCLFVAFISTFLPVYNIAMKRPIDAIRDR